MSFAMKRMVAHWYKHGFKRWLMDDRVRISPSEGRLLGLQVGQRVILADKLWTISSRQACPNTFRIGVRYHLVEFEDFLGCLDVSPIIIGEDEVSKTTAEAGTFWMDCYL